MSDTLSMRLALGLAEAGLGRVEPNPLVGAVVVRDGRVVGRGHHRRYGGRHAEIVALAEAGDAARGATVYVTLVPCGHHGKTPPCAKALVEAGVSRVVYAASDPNPVAHETGLRILDEAGVAVEGGLLEAESRALNRRYEAWLPGERPWVLAKWGASLDGRVADAHGGSKYITGERSRHLVHEIRGAVDGIMVGSGTVLADDPRLTCRLPGRRSPHRIVLDGRLRTPVDAVVVRTARDVATTIVTVPGSDPQARRAFEERGVEILEAASLREALVRLRERGLCRILLEGGPTVLASALSEGLVDQVLAFQAPVLLGGEGVPGPVGGAGVSSVAEPLRLRDIRSTRVGDDLLVEGFLGPER